MMFYLKKKKQKQNALLLKPLRFVMSLHRYKHYLFTYLLLFQTNW